VSAVRRDDERAPRPHRTAAGSIRNRRTRRTLAALAALAVLPAAPAACGYGSKAPGKSGGPRAVGGKKIDGLAQVKLGYFANVTHATPLVGLRDSGEIPKELHGTRVSTQVFNAGPAAIEALNAKALDMAWVGPSPAINGYTKSGGKDLKIVAGATSGGAALVVNPHKVHSLRDLKGKQIATPQLGNTQDVALLNYLKDKGYRENPQTGRGDVNVLRQDNKEIPAGFRQGSVDAAWVPQPTAATLAADGGKVLLNEKKLWKGGRFVTTNLVVRQDFLKKHPRVVEAVIRGSVRANSWIHSHPGPAKKQINSALKRDAGKPLPPGVLDSAYRDITVTDDPLAATLDKEAQHAVRTGLLKRPDLKGIYDLGPLNKVLKSEGRRTVGDAGLGG